MADEERKPSMPFGKYKNTPVTELSDGYLWWLRYTAELKADWLQAAVAAEATKRDLKPDVQPRD